MTRRMLFIALALALGLVAATPFLTRPGLPRQTDAELHVYRAAELGHTLRAGVFYPRWAPDFYFGYGYPIFNYYAPMTYYVANLFDVLPGVDVVAGVKGVFVLGLVLASLGSYLLGSDLFGDQGGILAAASFVFSPYVVFIDPHARGDLAEHFAICLLPLAFYTFGRVTRGVGGRWSFVGSVLSLASVVFSHNLIGLVAACLLFFYWLWLVLFGKGRPRIRPLLVFTLAATVIAFFWLPFVFERSAIKLEVVGPGHFDFREHFLSWTELFAPSRVLDIRATAPQHRFNLGIAQWLLALLGAGRLLHLCLRRGDDNGDYGGDDAPSTGTRVRPLYFVVAGAGLIFLMLPVSQGVWERVPGMAYLQFPWRLLGAANMMLAVCAASLISSVSARRWRSALSSLALAMVLAASLPVLYPPLWAPDFGGTAPHDIIEWEQHSLALGTTSTGDFLPVKAAQAPLVPMPSLVDSYLEPGPVDRVNREVLPENARLEIVSHGPLHDRFSISTPEPFTLRLYTFHFPGWRAYVDGEEVPIQLARPEGFITLGVPAGEHDIVVRFEDTPPRTAGWIIAAVGWVMLGVSVWVVGAAIAPTRDFPADTCDQPGLRPPLLLAGVLVLFVVLKATVIDPQDDWFRYTSPPGSARAAEHELRVNFGNQMALLGYDLPRQRVRSGGRLPVTLYWQALSPMGDNYQTFLHLVRPAHVLWGQEDHLHPAGLPTTRWPLDKYVWDPYDLHVPPGTPPGEYALNVGVYSMHGGYRLEQYNEQGIIVGSSASIGSIEVLAPRRQPRVGDLGLTEETMAAFPGSGVTLLGYVQEREAVTPGDVWSVVLFWRAEQDKPPARARALVLWNTAGDGVWRESGTPDGAPAAGLYPFGLWQTGEVVRDPMRVTASGIAAGIYHFGIELKAGDIVFQPEDAEGNDGPSLILGQVEFVRSKKEEN